MTENLNTARSWYKTAVEQNNQLAIEILESYFPELKNECKDMEIEITLKKWFEEFPDELWRGICKKDMLAWLEKQSEQESTDKVESKFKVGDWLVQEGVGTYKVVEVCKSWYEVIGIDGNQYSIAFTEENNCRLWTIQDAKDGDVLAAHECLVLFKEIDGLNIKCYCTYHLMNNQMFNVDTLQNKTVFFPATKEWRDLLFQKMKDLSGYEWDFNNKKLNKIEQNPAWSEEDESTVNSILSSLEYFDYWDEKLKKKVRPKGIIKEMEWLKSLKEKIKGE